MSRRAALLPLLALLLLAAWAGPRARAEEVDPAQETLLLRDPTISADHVVFVYAQDLWIVGRAGGTARRLTSHVGREYAPRLSPDGRLVAFSAEYEGNADVYVMSVDGGAPKRLTWHPGDDSVRGWHPDGRRILFASGRQGGEPVERLFLVAATGGMPQAVAIPRAAHAAYDATGARIAYTPYGDAFRTWKRYRGGRLPPVWIYDVASQEVEQVPHVRASDTYPCWLGEDVYFASDRPGEGDTVQMNIWRFRPGAKAATQVTRFTDFGVQSLAAGADVLVFAVAGSIRTYDPRTSTFTRLRIKVETDGLGRLPRWQAVKGFVRDAAIAPNGQRAVFEARGEIITVPREHGAPRNLTDSPGVHERSPTWSPDGRKIAWFSDAGGEYRLVVRDRLGREEPRTYDLGGAPFYNDPAWSPDGKHLLFSDKGNRLAYVTFATGKVTPIRTSQGTLGQLRPQAAWSPDSRWIAFEERSSATAYDGVALFDLLTGDVTRVTDGFSTADSPAFSTDGKYLFFRASVDSGPLRFGLDLSTSAARRPSGDLYVVVLKQDGDNPLGPRSDEGLPEKKKDAKKEKPADDDGKDDGGSEDRGNGEGEGDGKGSDDEANPAPDAHDDAADKPPSIDVGGIGQRILALPVPSGEYRNLVGGKGKLLYIAGGRGDKPALMSFDFESRKPKEVLAGVTSAQRAAGGKHLLVRLGSTWAIVGESGKDRKDLRVDGVKVRVEPEVEWPQILRECWRIQRDFFYDPGLHGVDWPAMWARWSAFLPHVQHRADLNALMMELMGELCCGHEYVYGGDYPQAEGGVAVGLLGADFEAHEGRYRITRIYAGQNWTPDLRAPLTQPGVDAAVGDYLIAVNGRPVKAGENLHAAFENTADEPTEITLSAAPDGADARTSTTVPLDSDGRLRRLAWIEANRRRVDELSGGRLAYVYMPNTARAGLAAFDRDFYSQLDKQGVILDERFNGGGQVADYVVDVLARDVLCYWMNREGWLGRTPFGTLRGPKVMIVNERAGSGGDCMPWMFKKLGLGPIVGTRTWGGLVGISGYPPLLDGGYCTAASFGIMDTDGRWVVENEGVTPDVEVIQWPKAVAAGSDPQLEKAVELALGLLEAAPPPAPPGYTPPAPR